MRQLVSQYLIDRSDSVVSEQDYGWVGDENLHRIFRARAKEDTG